MAYIIERGLNLAGIGAGYSAHSLRAGFVTAAGEAGASEWLIAAQTGRRSMSTLRLYFRRSQVFRSNACDFIGL